MHTIAKNQLILCRRPQFVDPFGQTAKVGNYTPGVNLGYLKNTPTMFMKGMSLTEVLVASFIMGTGILSLLALQAAALSTGIVSGHRQQASLLLVELAELSHISPGVFREIEPGSLITADAAPVCAEGTVCTPVAFLQKELHMWAASVIQRLPDAQVDIRQSGQPGQSIWTVNLSWHGTQGFSESSLQTELVL